MSKLEDIVLLSTADWDNPFWTNKQHVAVDLARRGHRVLYVDSIGLRRPSASARDIRRVIKRLRMAAKAPRQVKENIWVWSPVVLPWHSNGLIRAFNRVLFSVSLSRWLKKLGMKREWLWTYNPLTSEFLGLQSFQTSIYHCVDEIKAQPGMPVKTLEVSERRLSTDVDIIFTTSEKLTQTRKVWNDSTHYLPNVADFTHFNSALTGEYEIPKDLEGLNKPVFGFIGAISGYKLDFDLIARVAIEFPEASIVLIGEVGEGDPWTDISKLRKHSNIYFLGPKSYADLPKYLRYFDVALLPNNVNEYTDSMFPMKFFEYLAAGKVVVSVNLKALRDFGSVCGIAQDHDDFVDRIRGYLDGKAPSLESRISLAKEYTYEARTEKMIFLIRERASR